MPKYPKGDTRNGSCEEHINVALYWLRLGLDSNNGLPVRLNEECHPYVRRAIKEIKARFRSPTTRATMTEVIAHAITQGMTGEQIQNLFWEAYRKANGQPKEPKLTRGQARKAWAKD
jgi:hypothetical protein